MKILAIDLGKFKSMSCVYQTDSKDPRFIELATRPTVMHDLIVEHAPDRVVIEVGSQAGWVCGLVEALEVEIQVADPNHEAWRWKNNKRKTDRDDALKLAQLSHFDQLPMVHVPAAKIRQWGSLIAYRHTLVGRRPPRTGDSFTAIRQANIAGQQVVQNLESSKSKSENATNEQGCSHDAIDQPAATKALPPHAGGAEIPARVSPAHEAMAAKHRPPDAAGQGPLEDERHETW